MAPPRPDLPTGTVTFLRTDVEGSMQHVRAVGSRWDELNAVQIDDIRTAVDDARGATVRTEGDALFAVFPDASSAVRAAIASQRAIEGRDWPAEARVRIRVGLHAGEAHLAGDDYGGFDVNRAARIASVGHGGQIILSEPVRALVASDLPEGVSLRDLGRHQLKDVPHPEQLYQLDVPGLESRFPPPRTAAPSAGNLPTRLTSFVGRDRELAELTGLLADVRLVTIHGPGGIGKTSLAIEAARRLGGELPDGAWFVPLEAVTDPALVMAAVARALGLYDGPNRAAAEGVARHFGDRTALLVLDNFEQVLEAATQIPPLLRAAPQLRVVVTSRAPLRVAGEQAYPVGPLSGDGPDAAAERLFEDRARSAQPGWVAGDDWAVVDEICRLLDGLPLGIELAAARVALLPPTAIRDRLAARLPLPGGGPRDLPDRQRTLEGAIGWSYDLLTPVNQRLLRELAVFDGGFDIDQARLVATERPNREDVLDGLLELADQSLIDRDRLTAGSSGGGLRFLMLETIRSFALRALQADGEEGEMRGRHAAAFVALSESAAPHLLGAAGVKWLDRLGQDHANLRAAVRWAIEQHEVRLAQRLTAALWRYWQLGGHLREGRELADAVLDMPGADEPSPERLWSIAAAGGMAYWQGDTVRAGERYARQLEMAVQIGDRAGEADAAWNLGATDWDQTDLAGAEAILERARSLYVAIGDDIGAARTEWGRANLLTAAGRFDEALAVIFAARERYTALGDTYYVALSAGDLAWVYALKGEPRISLWWGMESLWAQHASRDVAATALTLAAVAVLAIDLGLTEEAAVLMSAHQALCEVHGVRPPAGLNRMISARQPLERLAALMTPDDMKAATERGRRMRLDEAVAYASEATRDTIADVNPVHSE